MGMLIRPVPGRLFPSFLPSTILALLLAGAMAMAHAATVTLSPVPAGGTVTSNVGGIVCGTGGSSCTSSNIAQGTTVRLTATPDAGYTFARWTVAGAGDSTDNPLVFPMGTLSVTGSATFRGSPPAFTSAAATTFELGVPEFFTVKATGVPAPTFAVTSGSLPAGVTLASGGTLSGTPAPGTIGTYPFTITAANGTLPNATQAFELRVVASIAILGVEKLGNGSGTVVSSPEGILCGATCSAQFETGTVVTLTATPAAGSRFVGWLSACGEPDPCAISLDENRLVAAVFDELPAFPPTTDLDGDGRSDILYRNATTGQVYRLLMSGLAIAGEGVAYVEPDTAWKIVADADLNADGVTDLLWRNDASGLFYFMPFNASAMPAGGSVLLAEPDPAWKVVHTPDLDGSGTADLLWWNSSTGQVWATLLEQDVPPTGAVVVGAQGLVYTEPDIAWKIVAVGDFAGSGKQNQLVWRNGTTGHVYLMTVGVTGGVFGWSGQMIFQEANTAWKVIGAADFDGDGKSDILWRNDATGMVYTMFMSGASITSQGVVYTEPDTAWKIVAQGDYDGNGKADLLWRNDTTGMVYMMLMNGLAIANQAMVYAEPNLAWKVLGSWEYGQATGILGADAGPGKSLPSALTGEPLHRGTIGGWPANPSPGISARQHPGPRGAEP